MAFSAVFYKTNKRANSTFIPSGTYLDTLVTLKENVSVIAPNLIINFNDATITEYNYVYIAALKRRYFVTEWRSINATTWECSCAVDVLASYKTAIGAQSHYVLRSASLYNKNAMDNKYMALSDVSINRIAVTTTWQTQFSTGVYILGIINDLAILGSVAYYVLDQVEMAQFKAWMMEMGNYAPGGTWTADINEDTAKFLFNPYQYIVSIEWFPLTKTELADLTTDTTLTLGWWDTNITAKRLNTFVYTKYVGTSSIVRHPQAAARGDYLNWSPFSSYRLFMPPIGDIELNAERCAELIQMCFRELAPLQYPPAFKVEAKIDLITGLAFIRTVLSADTTVDLYLYTGEAKLSVPITVASVLSNSTAGEIAATKNLMDTGKSILQSVVGTASGNISAAIDAFSTILSIPNKMKETAYDATAAISPKVQTTGNQGGLAAYAVTPYVLCTFLTMMDDDPAEFGRPLYAVQRIDTLSGYILCCDAVSNVPNATLTEQNQITQFLNGGFFYE